MYRSVWQWTQNPPTWGRYQLDYRGYRLAAILSKRIPWSQSEGCGDGQVPGAACDGKEREVVAGDCRGGPATQGALVEPGHGGAKGQRGPLVRGCEGHGQEDSAVSPALCHLDGQGSLRGGAQE